MLNLVNKRRPLLVAVAVASLVALSALVGLAIAAPAPSPPVNRQLPTITGTAQVGQTLTAQPGNWAGTDPITFAYQWLRCSPAGTNCVAIEGATGRTYVVRAADLGQRLAVRVTATNVAGTGSATSRVTAIVTAAAAPPPPPPPGGAIPIEQVNLPERLLIASVSFSPNRITSLTQRTNVTVRVTTTAGRNVRGALVFIRSTPLVTNTPPELATSNNGTVTFTIVPQSDLRLFFRRGYNLQFFVRARKPGENPLAGVSTRRLVQVPLVPGG
jgi:hypothetical protein